MDTPSKRDAVREPANRLISEPGAPRKRRARVGKSLQRPSIRVVIARGRHRHRTVHEINQPLASLLTSAQACRRLKQDTKAESESMCTSPWTEWFFLPSRVRYRGPVAGSSRFTPGSTCIMCVSWICTRSRETRYGSSRIAPAEKIKIELHFAKDIPTVRGDRSESGSGRP